MFSPSPLAILLFRSAQGISEDLFPFSILSSSFKIVISVKPCNSTGAISLFKSFSTVFLLSGPSPTGLFPGSYLTLLIFLELSSDFLLNFDVRMSYHQSNVFLQVLSNSFHRWLNLFVLVLPECLNNSWWCFSSSFSTFKDQGLIFSSIISVLVKIRVSTLHSFKLFRGCYLIQVF